jgi:hypothetical protein
VERRSPIFKVAILAFALMMAGAFVGYRVMRGSQPPPAEPGAPAARDETVFSGSKSEMIFDPPPVKEKEFMGGSKSMRISDPTDITTTAPAPANPKPPLKRQP